MKLAVSAGACRRVRMTAGYALLGASMLVAGVGQAWAQGEAQPSSASPSDAYSQQPTSGPDYGSSTGYGQNGSSDANANYGSDGGQYSAGQYSAGQSYGTDGAYSQDRQMGGGANGVYRDGTDQQSTGDGLRSNRPRTQNDQNRRGLPADQNDLSMARRIAPDQPTQFQRMITETTGESVPIFGADMFRQAPSTFAPVDDIPVTPDYVIGPGDEIRLQVWGQVNLRGAYTVDRTGSIALPQVGTLHVAGLHYSQLSDFVRSQLARVYRNFDLNVNLGQLRSIQVFVVGKVRQPGSYTIGSLSTLLNALFASGGPAPLGSLRHIQLRREGKVVVDFDLYDLVLHGDKSKDVPLEAGDVIFVPDVGPQVAVLGSVKHPAIYELRDETSYQQVVALAGGETNVAAGTGARVERIYNHAERGVVDINLKDTTSPPVQDGDVVIVNSILQRFRDSVTLRGNVANPGRYAWHPGMRISDLIPDQASLVTRDYYRRQDRLGQANLDFLPSTPPEPGARMGVQQDELNQMQEGALGVGATRAVGGMPPPPPTSQRASTSTGTGGGSAGAALTEGNSSFSPRTDVILSAPDIDWSYAVIERQNTKTLTTSLLPFNLGQVVLDHDASQNLELLPGDVVTVFSKADIRVPNEQQTKFVKLEGEFVGAGVYSVKPGETLRDLLRRAGGFTSEAYLYGSEFTRVSVRRLQRQRLLEYADSLESSISAQTASAMSSAMTDRDAAAAQASAEAARADLVRLRQVQPTGRIVLQVKPDSRGIDAVPDIDLEDGDRFVVPRIPTTVNVVGQVYSANAFVFQTNRKVRDYLQLAGGPERMADTKREFIIRADGSVVSEQYTSSRHLGDFHHLAMLPGDTIVVPPKVQKGNALRDAANIATILEGFGIAAAAIQVLR